MVSSKKPPEVKLKVSWEGKPPKDLQVEAYAFDRQGRFLASATVVDAKASLPLTEEQASRARLFFGPPLKKEEEQEPTLETMERLFAYEAVWRYDSKLDVQNILSFPECYWRRWPWCSCRVRGRVVRPVDIGGTTQELPVCHVRVHICEVDRIPWIILRLPDDRIFRLRDELLRELKRPLPRHPFPDPPLFKFDPGVIDPSPENLAHMVQPADSGLTEKFPGFEPTDLPELPEVQGFELSVASINPQPEPPRMAPMASLTPEAQVALTSASATVVRRALVDNVHMIIPYLCLWPWFWGWLKCDELKVVETDGQGRFDTTIWYLCFGDHPDLYFWVEACIGGTWTTVYRPFVGCNTYWNYACGSEVTLRVTDPRVPVCEEPPDLAGLQVAIMSIGNGISMSEIQGSAAGPNEGLTTSGQPFGGRLEPHVWFSRSALISAGITHYRWSYKRLTMSDGSPATDSWHVMDRRVIRHYAVIDPTPPDYPLSFLPYTLGPDPALPGQNVFQIQSVNPPAGSTGWAPIDAREDSASAFFLSHLLEGGDAAAAAGKYELKFELFKSGSLVNFTDEAVLLKVSTDPAPFGPGAVSTAPAANENLIKDGAGKVVGFRLVLRIDNNPCEASIYVVEGAGLTVNVPCGFIEYIPGASANIRFKARHPHDFARFRFNTHRGPSILVPDASAPPSNFGSLSVGISPANGFFRNAESVFAKTVPVHTLLTSNKPAGSPDCQRAAFAETLYVWALATDGWRRLSYLDARGIPKAFALAPA